ncbi:MAG: tRNA pseudouridine(55) synthase TruB [Pseudomonadota bacterium]
MISAIQNKTSTIDGVLVVDKPAGPTSHDIVSMVKRLTGASKIGHLGTLDPAASGVLPLAINEATTMAGQLAGIDKVYEFTLCLGTTTTTDDSAGDVIAQAPALPDLMANLRLILPRFTGSILQRPPRFSAIKVRGKRAYELARKGIDFELEPRSVRIDSIDIIGENWPQLRLRMSCNSGTYVRSLCRDLGNALGCGGHAKDIRRLKSGPYIIDKALTMDDLQKEPSMWLKHLILIKKTLYTP